MAILKSCCVCIPIIKGVLIIGWFQLIGFGPLLLLFITGVSGFDDIFVRSMFGHIHLEHHDRDFMIPPKYFFVSGLVLEIASFFGAISLILAANNKCVKFLRIYIFTQGLNVIMSGFSTVYFLIRCFVEETVSDEYIFLGFIYLFGKCILVFSSQFMLITINGFFFVPIFRDNVLF